MPRPPRRRATMLRTPPQKCRSLHKGSEALPVFRSPRNVRGKPQYGWQSNTRSRRSALRPHAIRGASPSLLQYAPSRRFRRCLHEPFGHRPTTSFEYQRRRQTGLKPTAWAGKAAAPQGTCWRQEMPQPGHRHPQERLRPRSEKTRNVRSVTVPPSTRQPIPCPSTSWASEAKIATAAPMATSVGTSSPVFWMIISSLWRRIADELCP